MKIAKNKAVAITIAVLLTLSMTAATLLSPNVLGQVFFPEGYEIPTYTFINVAPNPIGIGQTVTINFFIATPLETSENPRNMYVKQTNPDGTTRTLGPFTGDSTGGSYTTFVPTETGEYKFQFIYEGQTLTGREGRPPDEYVGLVMLPSESKVATLTVQTEPVYETAWPTTPLPSNYWSTPVTAQNVEFWYEITGPWLGYGNVNFGSTGLYNNTGPYNPYTESVLSGHILWTKDWHAGGVAGGEARGQDAGHYWSTRQYQPQYAPVIINGIMYSTHYPESTQLPHGILATDLYTGETLWKINTTNALRCGMVMRYGAVNQYGAVGPFIWTTGTLPADDTGGTIPENRGTQWNMYSAWDGQYILSIVNGTNPTLMADPNGNIIGYYINSTAGEERTYPTASNTPVMVNNTGPHLTCFNMTRAIGQQGGSWQPSLNTIRDWQTGVMWTVPVPTEIAGQAIDPALYLNGFSGDAVIMSGGYVHGQGRGGEVPGWLVVAAMDCATGNVLWNRNMTYPTDGWLLPFTRTTMSLGTGVISMANDVSKVVVTYDARTGNKLWETTLETDTGDGKPNDYDLFSLKAWHGYNVMYWYGLGGDIWAFNPRTGQQLWYTNTTRLVGDPGLETPYGIWPLWVFNPMALTKEVAYFIVGHEYNPPLFHGAQILAVNATNGELIWSELGTYIRSTAAAYGRLLSLNAYDNRIYCFGKGPSATTVSAPAVGIVTGTPVTITGTVMDVSVGSKRHDVAANFPNGLPCVSDASQSKWMEYVYQQQPCPANTIGVQVTLSVIDSNGNYRPIGTTTTNAMGSYGFTWTPDIPGQYDLIATYAGSNSYYTSSAETYFYASEAPEATPQPTQAPASLADQYILPGIAGIIASIAIVGVALALLLRKR